MLGSATLWCERITRPRCGSSDARLLDYHTTERDTGYDSTGYTGVQVRSAPAHSAVPAHTAHRDRQGRKDAGGRYEQGLHDRGDARRHHCYTRRGPADDDRTTRGRATSPGGPDTLCASYLAISSTPRAV